MQSTNDAVVFVWPGDLHLESAAMPNYKTAEWMVDEVNTVIRPDFVQFAGDNVQHAAEPEFELFNGLRSRLQPPHYPLVGDHDVHHDDRAEGFRRHVGETYGAMSLRGFRFIRLNTMQSRPLGISDEQIAWFRSEVDGAIERGERVVVFQHHYPYQIWESYAGPGIDACREIVQTRPITAIFAGHTHYGQIANDGRNVSVASRSIGEPEGGPAGYSVVYLDGDDLAVTYRSVQDSGPIALVTHPRDVLLATGPKHIVNGKDRLAACVWSAAPLERVRGRLDGCGWFDLEPLAQAAYTSWGVPLRGDRLAKGEHRFELQALDAEGRSANDVIDFMVDPTGRYTAVPRVDNWVSETKFC